MDGSGSNHDPKKDQPFASRSPFEEPPADHPQILVVEDNPADVYLIRVAIKAENIDADLHVVKDGEEAMRFFDEVDHYTVPCPTMVILDINLPKKQGGEVLQYMRKSRRCGSVLVVAISTSDSESDRAAMARLGANGYFHKPSVFKDFMKLGTLVKELLKD